ncbi:MAG: hypothetical protein KAS32_28565 [Candidatus Peribacteraceae bacterium]|nr:hypothetical protein [Candidatus Peribacteraceae bacterium]
MSNKLRTSFSPDEEHYIIKRGNGGFVAKRATEEEAIECVDACLLTSSSVAYIISKCTPIIEIGTEKPKTIKKYFKEFKV